MRRPSRSRKTALSLRSGLLVLAFATAAVALFATPALGAPVRLQTSIFDGSGSDAGVFSALQRIAIHQSSGTVYAIDSGRHVVDKFDASGAAQDFSALSSSSLSGSAVTGPDGPVTLDLGDDSDLAVDNSGTATDGRLYVLEEYGANSATAFAFDADGTYIRKITPPGADTCGIAVDSHGHVWIADYNSSSVIEYDASGVATGTTIDTSGQGSPCHIAFDSSDNLYVALYFGALQKYDSSGVFQGQVDAAWTRAVAIDPTTDHVFAVHADHVSEYDSAGAPFLTFGQANLSGATGVAVRGSTGEAYVSDASDNTVHVFGAPVTLPNATTGTATSPTTSSATLHGTINPEGAAVTDCHFQYGTTTAYGKTVPCIETSSDIGVGTGSVSVHADVNGLNASTDYHFRLVATNAGGTSNGADAAFSTTGPATITGGSFSGLSQSGVTVSAQINPRGSSTTYHVEYVDDAHFQVDGFTSAAVISTPESNPIGSDSSSHNVSQALTGLAGYTTYHVRVIATNTAGRTNGTDTAFTTASVPGPSGLPDSRAYELVSPAAKTPGDWVGTLSLGSKQMAVMPAADGQSILYPLIFGLPDATAGGELRYLASRTPNGWQSVQAMPRDTRPPVDVGSNTNPGQFVYVSNDLSCRILVSRDALSIDAPTTVIDAGHLNLYRQNDDGTYTPLNADPENPNLPTALARLIYRVMGVSDDCEHVVFQTAYTYPGVAATGVYEWDHGTLRNAAVLPDDTPATDAKVGFQDLTGTNGSVRHAVSVDGSRIFFSAKSNDGSDAGKTALYVRKDGAATVKVSGSQTSTPNRGARFQTASRDGSKVLFLANPGLTTAPSGGPTDADCANGSPPQACDLYAYDVDTGDLTNLSADTNATDTNGATVAGVLGASDDLAYVYFAAQGQLVAGKGSNYVKNRQAQTYNIYLTHAGHLSYVGQVGQDQVGGQGPTQTVTMFNDVSGKNTSQVTPDGRHLLFISKSDFAGYNSGDINEAYLYTADSETTVCVSCRPDGQPSIDAVRSNGSSDYVSPLPAPLNYQLPPNAYLRAISDDGSRVFFTSADPLAAGAEAGQPNVYLWQDGQIFLLGIGPGADVFGLSQGASAFYGASADGNDVFLRTDRRLVAQDVDSTTDLYDVRVGGGFPAPVLPVPCDPLAGDACPGPLVAPPGFPSLGSAAFSGSGNVPAPSAPRPAPKTARLKVKKPRTAHGTSTRINVKVPAEGKIRTSGSGLKRSSRTAKRAGGTYRVLVRLSKRARRTLSRKHRVRVRVTVRFTPKHGKRQRERFHVTFKPKKAKRHGTKATKRTVASVRAITNPVDTHGKVR